VSTLGLSIQEESLKRYVGGSLIVHISIVLILSIRAALFPEEALDYQSAIKVDLVALPDKVEALPTVTETTEAVETPTPAPTVTPVQKKKLIEKIAKMKIDRDAVNLDRTKKKEQAAIARLKQMSAFEELERQELEEAKRKAVEKLKLIKGNTLSSGTDLRGVSRLQHDNYISVIERHIRQNWSLPEWLAKKDLKAQVRVRFDGNGNITFREIAKSSGNKTFDDLALQAVEKSSPVPAPPPKFVRILNVEGILLGFPE
jgi:colicin import membrane protein